MAATTTATPLDTESDMLPQDPPAFIIRAAARLLITIFAVGLLAAIFVPLPETVNCPFVLVPKDGADPIQSPRVAVVHRIGVTEGQTVKQGTELFALRSDEIRGLDAQFRGVQEDLRNQEQDLTKADGAFQSQIDIKLAEISQAESEVKFREKHSVSSRELVARMEKLSKSGGISAIELIRLRLDLAESEKNFSVSERTLQQVKLEQQKLATEHSRHRSEKLGDIEKLKYRLTAFKGDLENSEQDLLSIRAPYDAVVISLSQRSPGTVVQNGQELCQLARADAQPLARLVIKETGLPQLAVGQRARFFLEAFPYQRYGAIDATLDWISPSVVASAEGPRFVALASVDDTHTSKRNRPLPLRVGMHGEAWVRVGKRTMIEALFEPIRQLRESVAN